MKAGVGLDPDVFAFYQEGLKLAKDSGVPFLVGGAYALRCYTGVERHTKDLDLFLRPADYPRLLEQFSAAGYRTELTDAHWLAKAFSGEDYVDFIFGSGKGLGFVDDDWFDHATEGEVLGVPSLLIPAEEMIWSKSHVMERERYDGADIAHLIRSQGHQMDWSRLLRRYGPHWRVLFSYLVLFGFIYPGERAQVPDWVMTEMLERMREDMNQGPAPERLCQGTLISNTQFLIDIERWGYNDARTYLKDRRQDEETERLAERAREASRAVQPVEVAG